MFVSTGYGSLRIPGQHVGGLFSLLRFPVLRDELVRRFKESNACYSMLLPLYEYAVCPRGTKVFDHPDNRSLRWGSSLRGVTNASVDSYAAGVIQFTVKVLAQFGRCNHDDWQSCNLTNVELMWRVVTLSTAFSIRCGRRWRASGRTSVNGTERTITTSRIE